MASKSLQALLFVCAGVIVLLFLKLMFDMSRSMNEMIGYAGTISQDVCETQACDIPAHNNPAKPCPVIAEHMTNEPA